MTYARDSWNCEFTDGCFLQTVVCTCAMAELSPQREFKTTASQAPIICAGSNSDRLDLFLERIGEKPPPDFTDNLAVQLGKLVEPFLLDWLQRTQSKWITERQRFVPHPSLPWCAATLDGVWPDADGGVEVVEVKHCGPWRKRKEIVKFYTPQVCVQMACRQASRGHLAVLQGNAQIDVYEIAPPEDYLKEMWAALAAFQLCVDTLTPPHPMPEPLLPPDMWKSIDLNTLENPLPNWAGAIMPALVTWGATKESFDLNEQARADIKALLPGDVGELFWNDITLTRNRRGAVTIKREVTP